MTLFLKIFQPPSQYTGGHGALYDTNKPFSWGMVIKNSCGGATVYDRGNPGILDMTTPPHPWGFLGHWHQLLEV